jgi:predicted nuclease of restriction endonuclease-like (RecB) superfamily
MKQFYQNYSEDKIRQTLSNKSFVTDKLPAHLSKIINVGKEKTETASRIFDLETISTRFSLPWSHYVMLVRRVKNIDARIFYESEALRNGWSVRQLDRQISSQFYERTLLSKNKAAMLKKGSKVKAEDILSAEEEIKDPYILEFLGLKDEYSESNLEETLIKHLENFLLELGGDFAFIGRQKRLRIGGEWYRIDLLFFHRKLKCLVVIDLKVGKFTHSDAGQMHLYLNYAKEHWTNKNEKPPIGLILCAEKNSAVAKYALEGLPNKVLASEYKLNLPDEKLLVKEIVKTRKVLEKRNIKGKK